MSVRTTAQPPRPPDMLADGTPQVTQFRTSRARQVSLDPRTRTTGQVIRRRRSGTPFFLMAIGAMAVLGSILFWRQIVTPWWTGLQNQWNYGSSRITQFDADVGHGGMSHFIAEYTKGEIVVVELSVANPKDYHVYTLTGMLSSEAKPVVLLSTAKDVHTGRIDLVIDVEGSGFQTVLYNTGSAFSEAEP